MAIKCSYAVVSKAFTLTLPNETKQKTLFWLFPNHVSLMLCDHKYWQDRIHLIKKARFWTLPEGILSIFSTRKASPHFSPIDEISKHEQGIYEVIAQRDRIVASDARKDVGRSKFHSLYGLKSTLEERNTAIIQYISNWLNQYKIYTISSCECCAFLVQISANLLMIIQADQKNKTASTFFYTGKVSTLLKSLKKLYVNIPIRQKLQLIKPDKIWKFSSCVRVLKTNNNFVLHFRDKLNQEIYLIKFCSTNGPGLTDTDAEMLDRDLQYLPKLAKKIQKFYSWTKILFSQPEVDPQDNGKKAFHSASCNREKVLDTFVTECHEKRKWKGRHTLIKRVLSSKLTFCIVEGQQKAILRLSNPTNGAYLFIKLFELSHFCPIQLEHSDERYKKFSLSNRRIMRFYSLNSDEEALDNIIYQTSHQFIFTFHSSYNDYLNFGRKVAIWTYLDHESQIEVNLQEFGRSFEAIVSRGNEQEVVPLTLSQRQLRNLKGNLHHIVPVLDHSRFKIEQFEYIFSWNIGNNKDRVSRCFAFTAKLFSFFDNSARWREDFFQNRITVLSKRFHCDETTSQHIAEVGEIQDLNERNALSEDYNFQFFKYIEGSRFRISVPLHKDLLILNESFDHFEMLPITSYSKLGTKRINYKNWTVSLCSTGPRNSSAGYPCGSTPSVITKMFGHAVIVIEGIEKGKPVCSRLHLVEDRESQMGLELTKPGIPEQIQNSFTWRVSKEQLTPLIARCRQLVASGNQRKTNERFALCNPKNGINCIHWAVKLLRECNIDIPNYGENGSTRSPKDYIKALKEK